MTLYTPFGSVFTFGNCTLSLTDGVLFGLIIGLCLCLSVYRRRSLFQKFCYLLLYSYVGALVALTIPLILPAGWDLSSQGTADALNHIQWIPFVSSWEIFKNCVMIDYYREFWRLVGGNLLLRLFDVFANLLNRCHVCKTPFQIVLSRNSSAPGP